jgi:hypothetical protein
MTETSKLTLVDSHCHIDIALGIAQVVGAEERGLSPDHLG